MAQRDVEELCIIDVVDTENGTDPLPTEHSNEDIVCISDSPVEDNSICVLDSPVEDNSICVLESTYSLTSNQSHSKNHVTDSHNVENNYDKFESYLSHKNAKDKNLATDNVTVDLTISDTSDNEGGIINDTADVIHSESEIIQGASRYDNRGNKYRSVRFMSKTTSPVKLPQEDLSFLQDIGLVPQIYTINKDVVLLKKKVLKNSYDLSFSQRNDTGLKDAKLVFLNEEKSCEFLKQELDVQLLQESVVHHEDPISYLKKQGKKSRKLVSETSTDVLSCKRKKLQYIIDIGTRSDINSQLSPEERQRFESISKVTCSNSTNLTVIDKDNICKECGLYFSQPKQLKRHALKTHKTSKLYIYFCYFCNKQFGKTKEEMVAHYLNDHSSYKGICRGIQNNFVGKQVYMCKECGVECPSELSLNWHLKLKHQQNQSVNSDTYPKQSLDDPCYKCNSCSYTCRTETVFITHNVIRHNGRAKPHGYADICPVCKFIYNSPYEFSNHMIDQHSGTSAVLY